MKIGTFLLFNTELISPGASTVKQVQHTEIIKEQICAYFSWE